MLMEWEVAEDGYEEIQQMLKGAGRNQPLCYNFKPGRIVPAKGHFGQ